MLSAHCAVPVPLLTPQMAPMQQFEMVSETAVHQRYLTVYDRRIKFCAHDNPAEVMPAAE
jgi:hypothetical protein